MRILSLNYLALTWYMLAEALAIIHNAHVVGCC